MLMRASSRGRSATSPAGSASKPSRSRSSLDGARLSVAGARPRLVTASWRLADCPRGTAPKARVRWVGSESSTRSGMPSPGEGTWLAGVGGSWLVDTMPLRREVPPKSAEATLHVDGTCVLARLDGVHALSSSPARALSSPVMSTLTV
jgi:hypothetical protein